MVLLTCGLDLEKNISLYQKVGIESGRVSVLMEQVAFLSVRLKEAFFISRFVRKVPYRHFSGTEMTTHQSLVQGV